MPGLLLQRVNDRVRALLDRGFRSVQTAARSSPDDGTSGMGMEWKNKDRKITVVWCKWSRVSVEDVASKAVYFTFQSSWV